MHMLSLQFGSVVDYQPCTESSQWTMHEKHVSEDVVLGLDKVVGAIVKAIKHTPQAPRKVVVVVDPGILHIPQPAEK